MRLKRSKQQNGLKARGTVSYTLIVINNCLQDEKENGSLLMPAFIGGSSAVFVIAAFYGMRQVVHGCQSRRRKYRIGKITEQLGDGKKLIDTKLEESDNDIV